MLCCVSRNYYSARDDLNLPIYHAASPGSNGASPGRIYFYETSTSQKQKGLHTFYRKKKNINFTIIKKENFAQNEGKHIPYSSMHRLFDFSTSALHTKDAGNLVISQEILEEQNFQRFQIKPDKLGSLSPDPFCRDPFPIIDTLCQVMLFLAFTESYIKYWTSFLKVRKISSKQRYFGKRACKSIFSSM